MSVKQNKIIIAVFLVICLVPSAGMLIFGPSDAVANEIQAPSPKFVQTDGSFNLDFTAGLSDWFDDRFCLRPQLSTAWAKINAVLFSTSVEDGVVLGSGDWLYYSDSTDDYCGILLSDEEIDKAAGKLSEIQEYCNENGIRFVFSVAPNKNSLYRDNMPARFTPGDDSNVRRLYAKLSEMHVNCADLHSAFRDEPDVLYFHTDSHWNSKGAALAADSILSAAGIESDFFKGTFKEGKNHTGDLYEMLYPSGEYTETDYVYSDGFTFREETNSRGGDAINFSTSCAGRNGSLLCWRDSFGNSLYPYLAEAFGNADFSRSFPYDPEKLKTGDYDTVVIEIVERNISWLAQ